MGAPAAFEDSIFQSLLKYPPSSSPVLNTLPFPALDGGRILFLIIEKVRGKKNNQKLEQAFNAVGFLLLLGLMALITINDFNGFAFIAQIFGRS